MKEKKKNIIIGQWYKNLDSSKNYIAKVSKVDLNYVYTEENGYIYIDKKRMIWNNCHKGAAISSYKYAELCTIEEIAHVLPKDHPDLLLLPQKHKFLL